MLNLILLSNSNGVPLFLLLIGFGLGLAEGALMNISSIAVITVGLKSLNENDQTGTEVHEKKS